MIDRAARAIVLAFMRRIHDGRLTILEGRQRIELGEPNEVTATMRILNPRAWRAFLRGSYGLATSYVDGDWESDDLVALTRIAARNVVGLDRLRARLAPVRHPVQRLARRVHAPTIRRSRRQIAAHYDLGNDLFALFLDETLSYSSGIFTSPETSLYEASIAKLDAVCRKLDLGPDDHVLEIGTGWGGFAIHAAGRYGARVTTTTISQRQYELARERVREADLEDRITLLLKDYRELEGRYDKLVSIEMIEAVGWQFFETYFRCCSRLLKPDGAMLLQAITIADSAYEVEKGGRSFVNTLIFPGGCLPSVAVIDRCLRTDTDMVRVRHDDLTDSYVRTVACWLERFEHATPELARRGYDDRFRRLWRLYLSYSEGGFAERRIRVGQFLLVKPGFRPGLRRNRVSAPVRAFAAGAQQD
jgi:cyclopropane-fatty-acyl-phospholipid synthase